HPPLPSFPTRRSSDLPPDLSVDLGPDLEVFEKWPVVLQRNPRSERGPRGIMNIAGRRRAAANPERRSRPRSDFGGAVRTDAIGRSEEHTSELQSRFDL